MTSGIEAIAALRPALLVEGDATTGGPGGSSFAALVDQAQRALEGADGAAAALAAGHGGIAEAAIARAKADVMLEIAAVAASRVSNAVSTLLQTQL